MWITFDRVWIRLRFCTRWKDYREWNIIMWKKSEKKKSEIKIKNEQEKIQRAFQRANLIQTLSKVICICNFNAS